MKTKLLIGIIVVIVGLVIATAISGNPMWAMNLLEVTLVGVWIYLVWMVRKKKTKIFHDQMEPKIAERRYKMLKAFLLVAGISLGVFIISVFLHNAIYGLFILWFGEDFWTRTGIGDEPVFFFIAIFSLVPFAVGTIGGLVIFLKGRRKTT